MKLKLTVLITLPALLFFWACQAGTPAATPSPLPTSSPTAPVAETEPAAAPASETSLADVLSVEVSGSPGGYTFSVEIASPDSGCDQYADWWEVLSEEGELLYRRVLLHSHATEQPFTRSGGPVPIPADQPVWVRAHMNPGGYGGQALKGSPQTGFHPTPLDPQFAPDTATLPPLPTGCAF